MGKKKMRNKKRNGKEWLLGLEDKRRRIKIPKEGFKQELKRQKRSERLHPPLPY